MLIHAGASGVGTAAVQLTRLAGAVPMVTAGSAGKLEKCKHLGAGAGFNYKELNGKFADSVLNQTSGKGVDLILDCVGGSFLEENARAISIGGRWIIYGSMGGTKVEGDLLGQILRKRLRLEGTTLRARSDEYKSRLVNEFCMNALPHFTTGKLVPVIDTVLPFGKIVDAHRMMEQNLNSGKIVITVRADAETISPLVDSGL